MFLQKIKSLNSYVASAIDVNIAVENDNNIQTYFLDQSSYIWATGQGFNGTGIPTSGSSPLAVIATRPYTKLITGGTGALDASGYAWTWGHNQYGNLGNNTSIPYNVPQSVVGGKRWLTLQAAQTGTSGVVYTGLDYSSYAWAWGNGFFGILGNNNTINCSSPISVIGNMQWKQITTVGIGLNLSSYAWTWGYNPIGQLGNNTTTNTSSPVSVVGNRQFLSVYSAGFSLFNSCYALDTSSYAWGWGNNSNGNLGDGTTTTRSSPVSIALNIPWIKLYPFMSLSNSGAGVLGIAYNNSVYMWGPIAPSLTGNSASSFSVPTLLSFPTLKNLQSIQKLVSISTSTTNDIALLDANSYVWVWGDNKYSQLGTHSFDNTSSAFVKPLIPQASYVNLNFKFNMLKITSPSRDDNTGVPNIFAIDTSSYLWGWGAGSGEDKAIYGYSADFGYAPTPASSPVAINQLQYINFISAANNNAAGNTYCGLDISSYAWFWGSSYYCQFGDNSGVQKRGIPIPVSVAGGRQWIKITTDGNTSWGIDLSSYVWGWGYNSRGQVGNNSTLAYPTFISSPVSVVGGIQVLDLQVGIFSVNILDSSSYAWTWGANYYGELGNNTTNNASSPISVIGNYQFTAIRNNGYTVLATDASSYIWMWGIWNNPLGIYYSSPFSIGKQGLLKNVNMIATDSVTYNTPMVYLDYSSYAWTWGTYDYRLGVGTATSANISVPTSVIGGRQFAYIESNVNGLIGTTTSPTSVYIATGSNATILANLNKIYFQSSIVSNSSPVVISIGTIPSTNTYNNYNYTQYSPPQTFTKITNGSNLIGTGTTFVLDRSSYLWGWGSNTFGELGYGTSKLSISSSPVSVMQNPLQSVTVTTDYSNTYNFAYALDISSYAWVWGQNQNGQFGNNAVSTSNTSSPLSIPTSTQWIKMVSDGQSCWAIDASSYAWAWGANAYGQIGNNAYANTSTPTSIIGGKQVLDIACGVGSSTMLDQSSYAWGFGNLPYVANSPTLVPFVATKITAPTYNVLNTSVPNVFAIDTSSYLWGWGAGSSYNGFVDFGYASGSIPASSPVSINNLQYINFISASIGGYYGDTCCGIDISSYAWFWGNNYYGQFGNMGVQAFGGSVPVSVVGGKQWIKIVMDGNTCWGMDLSSYVWAWGNGGGVGALGNNTTTSVSSPVSVMGGRQVLDIATGQYGACLLDRSSYAWCWGNGSTTGDNTGNNASSPVSVVGNRQFTAIRGASNAFLATDASSYIWVWGYNAVSTYSSPISYGKQGLLKNINNVTAPTFVYLDYSSYAWAWGSADYYLGIGTATGTTVTAPTSVIGGRQFAYIEANMNGLIGITTSPTSVYIATGSNAKMLANLSSSYFLSNTVSNSSPVAITIAKLPYLAYSPISVVGGRQFTSIKNVCGSGGNYLAVDRSSYLWVWGGNNTYGSLGNNSTTISNSPVSVVGGRQFIMKNVYINTDNPNACVALDASSYAWAWGLNTSGQLGDGTKTNRSSPVSVIGGYQWSYIEMGPNGLLGVASSFPNSVYYVTGSNICERNRYTDPTISYSSPTAVTFGQQYLQTTQNIAGRKNILGR